MSQIIVALIAFAASFLMGLVIVSTQRHHGVLTMDGDHGVQKIHDTPTPRIGGVALLAGAVAAGVLLAPSAQSLWWTICLCAIPAFGSGVVEDITKRVGAKWRLIATVLAGLIFCLATDYHLERSDIPGLDYLLTFPAFGVVLSAILIGGVANALNIIDGVNGLASGTAIIILSGFSILAAQTGDGQIFAICLVMIGAIAGFFVLNFPSGRLFLGDAGAYGTGFALAVLGIALPLRNPELSPLIALLALSYPLIETAVSIYRRLRREGAHPGQADRLHLHSLVYRYRAKRLADALGRPNLRNPLTAVVLWSLTLVATVIMVLGAREPVVLLMGCALVFWIYLVLYRRVALLRPLRDVVFAGRRLVRDE